jgi:hypothetical protein
LLALAQRVLRLLLTIVVGIGGGEASNVGSSGYPNSGSVEVVLLFACFMSGKHLLAGRCGGRK